MSFHTAIKKESPNNCAVWGAAMTGRGQLLPWTKYSFPAANNIVLLNQSRQKHSKAVVETFCRLHEDGIIYRDDRLVNWCVRLNTTLSDLEVRRRQCQLEGRKLILPVLRWSTSKSEVSQRWLSLDMTRRRDSSLVLLFLLRIASRIQVLLIALGDNIY